MDALVRSVEESLPEVPYEQQPEGWRRIIRRQAEVAGMTPEAYYAQGRAAKRAARETESRTSAVVEAVRRG